jgi:hypothetical protein
MHRETNKTWISTASLSSSYKPQYTPCAPDFFFMIAASSAPTSPKRGAMLRLKLETKTLCDRL